jgi:hypothetical protein
MSLNEPKIRRVTPQEIAAAHPTKADAPPLPAPGTHAGTLPGSSVAPGVLERDGAAGNATKGVKGE